MKRIVSILVSFIMILSLTSAVNAADEDWDDSLDTGTERQVGDYRVYTVADEYGAYTDIIEYVGEDNFSETYEIPKELAGHNVRMIMSNAFKGLQTLKNVVFNGSEFVDFERSTVLESAFYNCDNMQSLTIDDFVYCMDKCVENCDKFQKITCDVSYARISICYDTQRLEYDLKCLPSGASEWDFGDPLIVKGINDFGRLSFKLDGKTVKGWKSSNPKAIKISSKGAAVPLMKGDTTISVIVGNKAASHSFRVNVDPQLTKAGKEISEVSVNKGKTVNVKIIGKADSINNKYTNTSKAKIVSKPSAKTLKIKGLKRGTTTLKVKVNGVKTLKLKVKVK